MRGVFITGTDTDIGKTLISAWLCAHLGWPYWKPIQTGQERDTDTVCTLAGVASFLETYHLPDPVSPHLAAQWANIDIDLATITLPAKAPILVEGAGGVLVPVNAAHTMVDVMVQLGLPVIVVAKSTLGTINHTCLTLEALRNRNIDPLGVILNGPSNAENAQAIETYGRTTVLAQFPRLETLSPEALKQHPLPEALMTALNTAVSA